MRTSIWFLLVFLFSIPVHADPPKSKLPPPPLNADGTSTLRSQARTKQTAAVEDKTKAASMPRDLAQQMRGDQLEIQIFAQQAQKHIDELNKRVKDVLDTYGTTLSDVDLETGNIRRPQQSPVGEKKTLPKPVKK